MKQNSITIPAQLVKEIKTTVKKFYSGDLCSGILMLLKKNLGLLKEEEIVFKEVQCIPEFEEQKVLIKDSKATIEYGHFSRDIINHAISRRPYVTSEKVIKALLIAAYSADWIQKYNEYFLEGHVPTKGNLKKEFTLENWKAITNHTTPQWATYLRLPITNAHVRKIKCNVITSSLYYRFGFKFLRKNGKLFGDGSIQSLDNNFVIHLGKNYTSTELFLTTYNNGIRQRPDKFFKIFPENNKCFVEVLIDEENFLHFNVNGKNVHSCLINKEIEENVYIMAWGDGNEFKLSIEDIQIETEDV